MATEVLRFEMQETPGADANFADSIGTRVGKTIGWDLSTSNITGPTAVLTVGHALAGDNDRINIANASEVNEDVTLTGDFSCCLWLQVADNTAINAIYSEASADDWLRLNLGSSPTDLRISTGDTPTTDTIILDNAIPIDTWFHLTIVREGTTLTPYINGVANSTTATVSADDWNIYQIGRSSSYYLDGAISDFRLFTGALTAAEVASIAGVAASGGGTTGLSLSITNRVDYKIDRLITGAV